MDERLQLLGLCIDRLGYIKGARLAEFIAQWEICVRKSGGPVGTEEFAAWWKDSRRTTYRRLDLFREAFPQLGEHSTPNDLMRPLLARLAAGETPEDVSTGVLAVP